MHDVTVAIFGHRNFKCLNLRHATVSLLLSHACHHEWHACVTHLLINRVLHYLVLCLADITASCMWRKGLSLSEIFGRSSEVHLWDPTLLLDEKVRLSASALIHPNVRGRICLGQSGFSTLKKKLVNVSMDICVFNSKRSCWVRLQSINCTINWNKLNHCHCDE